MDVDTHELFKGEPNPRAEVVIGLVGAMGTDLDEITQSLSDALTSVAYDVKHVRVSGLISEFFSAHEIDVPESSTTKLDLLMNLGDALRLALDYGGAAAALAVGRIASDRSATGATNERSSVATILRQLKHPDEVTLLRSIYGPRFVLVGVWSPEVERMASVDRRLRFAHAGEDEGWYAQHVRRLLLRDEKDVSKKLGQRVRDTYEMADAFIALSPGRDSSEPAGRLIRLLFGSPYETPDRHEQAMYFCSGASMRSSDAGRQVGAVVVDDDGELLVTGVNEVPKPLGGQYWSDDEVDLRDFKIGYDENARQKLAIVTDLMKSLAESEWLGEKVRGRKPEDLAREAITEGGPLAKNRIGDLLEFARVAHAEMAAICTAARRGIPIGGQTMYTTTYPCHECARLIIAAGIRKVVYIDPYPKSQVRVMYAREVTDSDVGVNGTVAFEPFKGVAPRLFRSVFRMTGRDRDEVTGEYAKWDPRVATPRLVTEALVLPDATTYESKLYEPVYDLLTTADWEGVFKKAFPLPT